MHIICSLVCNLHMILIFLNYTRFVLIRQENIQIFYKYMYLQKWIANVSHVCKFCYLMRSHGMRAFSTKMLKWVPLHTKCPLSDRKKNNQQVWLYILWKFFAVTNFVIQFDSKFLSLELTGFFYTITSTIFLHWLYDFTFGGYFIIFIFIFLFFLFHQLLCKFDSLKFIIVQLSFLFKLFSFC